MKILILAAHPDDEILGCGGSIAKWSDANHDIYIHILSEGTTAQYDSAEIETKRASAEKIKDLLGIKKYVFSDFPDAKLDTIPLINLVKEVSEIVDKIKPEVLISQHHGDISQDHQAVFKGRQLKR